MIRFNLRCAEGHHFEAWFRSNRDFEDQKTSGLVSCGLCGDGEVEKALMAPAVQAGGKKEWLADDVMPQDPSPPAMAGTTANGSAHDRGSDDGRQNLAPSDEQRRTMQAFREMVDAVRQSSEDVGERFPEEARKIHYGETKTRNIRGKASMDQARDLLDEGIAIMPLPVLDRSRN